MADDPLKDRVLTIVTIIAQCFLGNTETPSEGALVEELLASGFGPDEIEAAFSWLEHLSLQPRDNTADLLAVTSHRVFTAGEARLLSAEARGFLVRLRSLGILDDSVQEEIIEKALEDAEDEVSLDELKAIAALTVFARSQVEWQREVDCILDDDWTRLYH